MCPIPCGPRRGYGRTSSPMITVIIDFWTDKFLCEGGQAGGCTSVCLGVQQVSKMKKVIAEHGRDFTAFHEFAPDLCNKFIDACYRRLEFDMATEAYNCSDFQGEEFNGWSKSQKIAYIRRNSEDDIRNMFSIRFEVNGRF